jgi:flagellar basal-body rod modification protein FlgD
MEFERTERYQRDDHHYQLGGADRLQRQLAVSSGNASFVWDGKGNDGTQWPAGDYKMTVTAKDSAGNNIAISTEIQGTVDSVDLTASPALLSIGGKNYTADQIKRIVRTASS